MKQKKLAIATHTATIDGKQYDGIGDAMRIAISAISPSFHFVRHSMDGEIPSRVERYKDGVLANFSSLRVMRRIAPLRYVNEIIASVWYFSKKSRVDIYLGVDPLNALAGVILKKLGRIEKAIFYTADYSPSRFGNCVMDGVYHWIDRFCVRYSDEVWSVSTRIVAVRKRMGLPDEKNILVPNAPPKSISKLRKQQRNTQELITLGIIDKQLDFANIIVAIKELEREYPKLQLTVIGNGPEEASLKKLVSALELDKRVHFLGRLDFEIAQRKVASAGIGLALYTGIWGFNIYGDSTKCREYFALGLPVLSTNTHSTVEEIVQYDAGVISEQSTDDYKAALVKILNNYDEYSHRATKLGEKYEGNREAMIKKLLS